MSPYPSHNQAGNYRVQDQAFGIIVTTTGRRKKKKKETETIMNLIVIMKKIMINTKAKMLIHILRFVEFHQFYERFKCCMGGLQLPGLNILFCYQRPVSY